MTALVSRLRGARAQGVRGGVMMEEDYIWSEACEYCEGSGKRIRWWPATYWEPAWYDHHPFEKCDVCDGTGATRGTSTAERPDE